MNKHFRKVFSFILSAALLTAAVPEMAVTAFAETSESPASGLTLSPVIMTYSLTTIKDGKLITRLNQNSGFNMTITVKDIKVKTSDISGAADIDFIKNLDSFKGTVDGINVLSSGSDLLIYQINLKDCIWTGGDTSFGFMLGYTGGSDYANCSINVSECATSTPSFPDEVLAEPIIKITGVEPDAPIKAGETGEFKIRLKNMGSTDAYNVLAEITPSDDILIIEGTGTQEIGHLDYKDERTITVKYRALGKITSLRQNFGVTLRYYYENGTSEVTGSASAQVSVPAEISTSEKAYPVLSAEFSLAETEITADSEYTGLITLKNAGAADIKGIFATITGSEDIIIMGGTGSKFIDSLPAGEQKRITVKFRTLKDITSLRQHLDLSLKFDYFNGSDYLEGSFENSFIMFGKAASSSPLPIITSEPLENALEAGKSYRKAFVISNKGGVDMQNITVRVKGSEGLTITNGKDNFFVERIKAGGEKKLTVYFNTNAELTSVNQTLDIELEYYYDKSGVMTADTKTATVTMNSEISTAPVLKLIGEKQSGALVSDTEYEYVLTVKNYGDITVRNIFVDLTATDAFYFLDGTEAAHIDIIRPGDTADITVKFRTLEDITSVKQGITAEMKYTYGRNNSLIQKESSSSVVLIASPNKNQDGSDNNASPNIIIGKYDIGADQIAAGDVFTLALDFYNTSAETGIENIVMTVNAGGDLSIYGGSSSFYYPTLAAAGSASESIQLRALPTAQTGTSSVNISFKYDYLSGGNRSTVTGEQTIYIPLYQPDKMTFSVNQPGYEIYAGNEVYITLTYLNKGRSDAANVKAELVGDVAALSTEKIIGNVAAGGNGSVDFVVTPYMSGEVTFSIVLTYEDSNMNEVTQELPVTLNVMEMMWEDPGYFPMTMEMPGEAEGGFPWWIVFVGGGVLLAAAVVVIIVVVHKKKKNGKKLTADDIDWEDEFDSDTSDSDKTKV